MGPRVLGGWVVLALSGCFASSPEVGADTSDGDTTTAPTSGSSPSTDTTGEPTADTSGDSSGPSTTSGSAMTTGEDASTGDEPSTTTGEETGASSSGGPPDWVLDCAAVGITVIPVPPVSDDVWNVQFEHRTPLTNLELTVTDQNTSAQYGPSMMCSNDPPCWAFEVVGAWQPGPVSLSIAATDFAGAACDIELF